MKLKETITAMLVGGLGGAWFGYLLIEFPPGLWRMIIVPDWVSFLGAAVGGLVGVFIGWLSAWYNANKDKFPSNPGS